MIYAKIENPEEKKRLEDALKASKNKSWYRRLQVIQNSANGITVPKLNEIFSICQIVIKPVESKRQSLGNARPGPAISLGFSEIICYADGVVQDGFLWNQPVSNADGHQIVSYQTFFFINSTFAILSHPGELII